MTIQSNIQHDRLVVPSAHDLSGMVGRLAKLVSVNGKAAARLPEADADAALYVIDDVRADGKVELLALHGGRNYRVVLQGTIALGDPVVLSLADHAGKVRGVPNVNGDYTVRGFAEDNGVDGQQIRVRPALAGVITVEDGYE
jgi:hypothetical protein